MICYNQNWEVSEVEASMLSHFTNSENRSTAVETTSECLWYTFWSSFDSYAFIFWISKLSWPSYWVELGQVARLNVCRFVLKTDDDAFVNMLSLLPRLHTLAVYDVISSTSSSSMLLICNTWRREVVARTGKWRTDTTVWRHDYWPTFCQGLAFIMTVNFVMSANQLVHRVPRVLWDDVSTAIYMLNH